MSDFTLVYDHFDPGTEGLRESLTSTGNGYFCTRGTAEWEDAAGVHYPGTYVHGGFNRETTILGGRPVLNEDLVNLPNWLVLKLRIEGEEAIRLDNVELISYQHSYDIRLAMVQRVLRFRDRAGRETTLRSRRFVSMAQSHQAGIEWTLTPQNWSGRVEVISGLDGRVTNQMVARYRELEGRHLDPVSPRTFGPETIALKVRTRQSNIYVAQAARTRVFRGGEPVAVERDLHQMQDYIQSNTLMVVALGARDARGIPQSAKDGPGQLTSVPRALRPSAGPPRLRPYRQQRSAVRRAGPSNLEPVGARNAAHVTRPADTRGAVHRAGRRRTVFGSLASRSRAVRTVSGTHRAAGSGTGPPEGEVPAPVRRPAGGRSRPARARPAPRRRSWPGAAGAWQLPSSGFSGRKRRCRHPGY